MTNILTSSVLTAAYDYGTRKRDKYGLWCPTRPYLMVCGSIPAGGTCICASDECPAECGEPCERILQGARLLWLCLLVVSRAPNGSPALHARVGIRFDRAFQALEYLDFGIDWSRSQYSLAFQEIRESSVFVLQRHSLSQIP